MAVLCTCVWTYMYIASAVYLCLDMYFVSALHLCLDMYSDSVVYRCLAEYIVSVCTHVCTRTLSVCVPTFVHVHCQCCVPVFRQVHCQCYASVFRPVHCQRWCLRLWLSQVPPLHVLAVCSETNLVQRLMDYVARLAARAVTHTSLHVLGANVTASPYPWAPYFLHGTPGPKPRHPSSRLMVCDPLSPGTRLHGAPGPVSRHPSSFFTGFHPLPRSIRLHGMPGPAPRHSSSRFMVCDPLSPAPVFTVRQVLFLDTLLASLRVFIHCLWAPVFTVRCSQNFLLHGLSVDLYLLYIGPWFNFCHSIPTSGHPSSRYARHRLLGTFLTFVL